MDIQPQQSTQPISDDQALAQALAGVTDTPDAPASTGLSLDTTTPPVAEPATPAAPVETPAEPAAITLPDLTAPTDSSSGDLSGIKKDAISELRPLVDKLDLPADEKFDTYLLLIRSTDDKTLIAPAHAAAQAITDETRKAQALLDIIKEIDYLNNPQGPQA